MLEIVEKFISLSGEAPIVGEPVFLIRFSRCNLACRYCDTPYHEEINETISAESLVKVIKDTRKGYPGLKVLFTGGEPLLGERQSVLLDIVGTLPDCEFYVETNGSIKLVNFSIKNVVYVVDWKTPSSGMSQSFEMDNLKHLRHGKDCIKFVVSREDLQWTKNRIFQIQQINPGVKIYLSPQWDSIEFDELAGFIIENSLPAAMSLQLHKIVWGSEKRGV